MRFHPDAPIAKSDEDRLGRDDYANGIAGAIRAYAPSDSVTVGILGPWGSGKTSLINLVLKHLEPQEKSGELVVMRFNPWRYSGTDYLFASFFATLAEKLAVFDSIEALKKASAKLKSASKITGMFKGVPHVGGALSAISGLFSSAGKNVESLVAEVGTLDAIHESLSKELAEAKKRVLVVIDDIDRLDGKDILDVFRLVKSLADFPYVMYMLAYDESVILRAIDHDPAVARKYLEKIVTLPIPVPAPHRSALDDMVVNGIYELMKADAPEFVNERRVLESYNSFKRYFKTMRDVARYGNLFAFNYARLRRAVDIGDVAALTALQVFEPDLYRAMPEMPDAFIDNTEAQWRQDRTKPGENKARVKALFATLNLTDATIAIEVLRQTFYKVDLAWKGNQYQFSGEAERAEHRASCEQHFFRALNMGVQPIEMEDGEYEQALSLGYANSPALSKYLPELGTMKTQDFISRIEDDVRVFQHNHEERANLAAAILDVMEDGEFGSGRDGLPFDWKVGFAIDHIIEVDDASTWLAMLRESIEKSSAVNGVMNHVARVDAIHAKGESRRHMPQLSDAQVADLRALAVERVRSSLNDGSLMRSQHLGRILYLLEQWSEAALEVEILTAVRGSASAALNLLMSFRRRGGFEGYLKPSPMSFELDALAKHIPPSEMNALLTSLDESTSTPEQREAIQSYRRQTGGGDEFPPDF